MSAAPEQRAYPAPGRPRRLALAAPAVAMTLASLDQNILAPALPAISDRFGGPTTLAWVASAFMLSATVTMPIHGRLSDRYGRRRILAWAILIFILSSLAAAAASDDVQLIAARAAQGIGAGGLIVLAQALIADIIPPEERVRYQGLFVTIFAACSLLGPLLGGVLTDSFSWRWIFIINLPLGLVALGALFAGGPLEAVAAAAGVDIIGAIAFLVAASAALGLLEALTHAPAGHLALIGTLCAAFLAAGSYFLRRERRGQPLFPADVIDNRRVRPTLVAMVLLGAGMFSVGVFLPAYLQSSRGLTASGSGLLMLPTTFGLMIGSRLGRSTAGLLWRPRLGLSLAILACAATALGIWKAAPIPLLALAWSLLGCGVGLSQPALVAYLQNAVPAGRIGVATATATFGRSLGGAFGIAAAGAISSLMTGSGMARSLPPLAAIFGCAAIGYMLAMAMTLSLSES